MPQMQGIISLREIKSFSYILRQNTHFQHWIIRTANIQLFYIENLIKRKNFFVNLQSLKIHTTKNEIFNYIPYSNKHLSHNTFLFRQTKSDKRQTTHPRINTSSVWTRRWNILNCSANVHNQAQKPEIILQVSEFHNTCIVDIFYCSRGLSLKLNN